MATPGTLSAARIGENAGAADVTLTPADLTAIRDIFPSGGFDVRYAETGARAPNRVDEPGR